MKSPLFSIIIPVRSSTDYLKETIRHTKQQSFKNYELLVITDKISKSPNPAFKRNLGAKMAKGKYLAFLDDDSYPSLNYLKNTKILTEKYPDYAAFCGPCLTPPIDNMFQQASGLVWSSFLGSGGAGVYRNSIQKPRFVDDYPSVNLIVKKVDFLKVGGFNQSHWPGEDTILCLDLTHRLKKKILYHPSVVVYHHRRQVIIPHLQQITRYALHRGYFAKKYPQTSLRFSYFLPSFFLFYLLTLPFTRLFLPLYFYLILLFITFISFLIHGHNLYTSTLATITIPLTHLYYGFLFIIGLLKTNLDFLPHKIKNGQYVGG